jgi:hypothetical protein
MSALASGDIDSVAHGLLQKAATWRLLGLLFERPRAGWQADVTSLAGQIEDEDVRCTAREAGRETEGIYLRCIGPGGIASPREVGYRTFDDPGWVLADVQRYYEAFGFRPSVEYPPDHVAVETAFVGFLFLKEAYARVGADPDGERTAREARERFLTEHLATFAAPLAERLADAGDAALVAAARALAARVRAALTLPRRSDSDGEEPLPSCSCTRP